MPPLLKPSFRSGDRSVANRSSRNLRRRSPLVLFLLLLLWSIILGWGMAQAAAPTIGTVDVVPSRYQFGQQTYLATCATCHVGLPPAVMPTQTWADLLQDSQHYGTELTPLKEPYLTAVWKYISTYSRPILRNESIPYRLYQSRYFKALHPKVQIPRTVTVGSCIACHPAASQFDFRSLTPEWQDAP
jgi:cytochrome c553